MDCASLLRLMYTSAFSHQLNIRAGVGLIGNYFNENVSEWEPLIEPVADDRQVYRHWELNFEVRKAVVTRRPFRCKFIGNRDCIGQRRFDPVSRAIS